MFPSPSSLRPSLTNELAYGRAAPQEALRAKVSRERVGIELDKMLRGTQNRVEE